MSKRKRLFLTGLFTAVSFVILFYPYKITVRADGKTVPAIIYAVDAPISGKIIQVPQGEGSSVRAGEIIAILHSDSLNNEILQQTKEVEILTKQIRKAELELQDLEARAKRYQMYMEVGTVSAMELKKVENELSKAQVETALIRHRLEKGQVALEHLRSLKEMEVIKASADGVILSRLKDKLGMVLPAGEEILRLASHETALEFLVPEDQAQHISPGSKANVRFTSNPFTSYQASVVKLDEKVDEAIERMWLVKNVIRITAKLDEPLSLTSGMKVRAEIHSQGKTNLARRIAARFFL